MQIYDKDIRCLNCIQELKEALAGISARVAKLEKEAKENRLLDELLRERDETFDTLEFDTEAEAEAVVKAAGGKG